MDNHHHHHRSTKLHMTRTLSRSGAASKSASRYDDDDVFNSPALLSPSEEIYREIFAGFHGGARGGSSTIPILDLPPVDENEALFDFRLFDYSEVFGGVEGMIDYAVPFHKLFRQSNGGDVSSSDDAWTPVETECLSEEWDDSSYSSKRKSSGNEINLQAVNDGKHINMFYQRKHQSNEGLSNTAHVAPVHAVPGYAVLIEQIPPPQKIGLQNPLSEANGMGSKLIKREKREEQFSDKTEPYPETVELKKADVRNASNEMFITISEINLRTQPSDVPPPSRPPPIFDARCGNISRATSSVSATGSSRHFSRSISGDDSPPFIDVEVDGRFSAADLAPSMTDSVKTSQATPKKIQENIQKMNVVMRQVNDETECNVAASKSHNSFDDLQHRSRKVGSSTSNTPKSSPDAMGQNPILNLSGKKKSKLSWSSEESCEARSSGEWVKVPEFIELVQPEKTKTHKQQNGKNYFVQNRIKEGGREERRIPEHEDKINERMSIRSNKLEDHVKISEAVALNEVITQYENYNEVLVCHRTTHPCKEVERKVYVEDQQLDDDIFIDIVKNEYELGSKLCEHEHKVNFDKERLEDKRKHHEVGPKECSVTAEDDQRVGMACETQVGNLNELAHQNMRLMNTNAVEEKQDSCLNETVEEEEHIKKQKKYDEKEQKEKQLKETERTSSEISENEENERRKKEEEYVAKLMEASENEAEDMLKEALKVVNKRVLMEDFERAERESEMKNDSEQPPKQESSVQLSQSSDMIFQHTDEKEPDAIKKTHRDLNMITPDVDISPEVTHHHNCKDKTIKEENIKVSNSVCESDQNSYEGGTNEEYVTGNGTDEQPSATKENTALPNRTDMSSSNTSGEASIQEDQIGVRINRKVTSLAPDCRYFQEKVKFGKVTMRDTAQSQAKVAPYKEVDIDKDKVAQKTASNKKSEIPNSHLLDEREQSYNLSQQSKTSQNVGGKENWRNARISLQEKAKLERERRAREVELERLREMEEEWEREREREKDRVAFKSVARNVREGAYAGLGDRAAFNNSNIAEAREKELANARERLEKTFLDSKEKLHPDKMSMESKMRQDQYAIKRANGEAYERADRSFSYVSADYTSTSIYNDGGAEGESAQRCEARLKREQRTAERAAKALAEKNTRDVIAQREQAERHRLAESLDAEVKRWANGKQGNLRALLSTLQYILGAESGWKPVPLTEIITSVAVKKAYRKATLCVHPDKLQQRRATLQQKYICEKVFDLLKEAWNRFNSEER